MDEKGIQKRVCAYREQTYRSTPGQRLYSIEEALAFVNQRGFIFFWPIKGVEFPSLWKAVAGARTVADDHDDPGHITWDWKDQMLGKQAWYYGRILRKKNTIISLESFPYFYALTPNYGEFEVDYLNQYQQGLMTAEAKSVYEVLLFDGPMDTISLRRAARMSSSSSASRFQRALDQLQYEMKILPTGISDAGGWRYAFIYDIVPRHFPFIEQRAGLISEVEAHAFLLSKCLLSLGMASFSLIRKLFRWKDNELYQTVRMMAEKSEPDFTEIELAGEKSLILRELL